MQLRLVSPVHANTTLEPIECIGSFCPSGTSVDAGASSIEEILTMVIGFLTIVAGLAFFIYFLVGGLTWITAGGDKGKVEEAKTRMTNGAIGMIIIVAAYGITWIVGSVLGIDILNPAELIGDLVGGGGGGNIPDPGRPHPGVDAEFEPFRSP